MFSFSAPKAGRQFLKHSLKATSLLLALMVSEQALARIYITGNATDVVRTTTQSICLAGGGSDDAWASGWKEMLTKANGGDVVIIRADGNRGGYEDWIYNDPDMHGFPKVNSVTTLSFRRAQDVNEAGVEDKILKAEMIFFAGGDQSKYVDWFRGTRMMSAVEYMMNVKKVPVGGTSAGMALMAGIDYAAHYSSPSKKSSMVTAMDVLKDPTGIFVDLDRTVLTPPFMNQVVTESHFSQRAREGRLVGFMARAVYNNYGDVTVNNIKGIGADEGTAVCYDGAGKARVHGAGNGFFLKGNSPIERIQAGAGLDWFAQRQAVSAYVMDSSNSAAEFDLTTWTGTGGRSEFWYVDGSDPLNPVFGRN